MIFLEQVGIHTLIFAQLRRISHPSVSNGGRYPTRDLGAFPLPPLLDVEPTTVGADRIASRLSAALSTGKPRKLATRSAWHRRIASCSPKRCSGIPPAAVRLPQTPHTLSPPHTSRTTSAFQERRAVAAERMGSRCCAGCPAETALKQKAA